MIYLNRDCLLCGCVRSLSRAREHESLSLAYIHDRNASLKVQRFFCASLLCLPCSFLNISIPRTTFKMVVMIRWLRLRLRINASQMCVLIAAIYSILCVLQHIRVSLHFLFHFIPLFIFNYYTQICIIYLKQCFVWIIAVISSLNAIGCIETQMRSSYINVQSVHTCKLPFMRCSAHTCTRFVFIFQCTYSGIYDIRLPNT